MYSMYMYVYMLTKANQLKSHNRKMQGIPATGTPTPSHPDCQSNDLHLGLTSPSTHWLSPGSNLFSSEYIYLLGMSSSQLTFTPSFFRGVGIPPTRYDYVNIYLIYMHILSYWCVLRREWMGCWGLLG